MSYRILPATYTRLHLIVSAVGMMRVSERTAVVMVMIGVTVMPVSVMSPTCVEVPPTRPVVPVPRAMPCIPCVAPKPIVDYGSENINRFYYVIGSVHIFIADYLNRNLIFLVLLYIYRGNILEHILCQYSLDNNQVLVVSGCLYHAQIIHHSFTVQVKIGESGVRVIEHGFELLNVLNRAEQCSHRLQIKRLAYVL